MASAKGDAPAKSFVTRGGQTVFKNTLDSPFRLEWPEISYESTEELLDKLRRSFVGMQELREQKRRRKKETPRKQPGSQDIQLEIAKRDCVEPPTKKQCLKDIRENSEDAPTECSEEIPSAHDKNQDLKMDCLRKKHSQLLIGTNSVSRELERNGLRAGIVCLSAAPPLRRHILMLAATRGVPFAGLIAFSKTAAPLLGVKTALAVGFKKLTSSGPDFFPDLVGAITRLAPPLNIPWLTVGARSGRSMLELTPSDLAENKSVHKHDFSCGDSTSKSTETSEQQQGGSREETDKSCCSIKKGGGHDTGKDKQPHPRKGKSGSGRKWRKQKQRNKRRKMGSFVTPEVQYFPQNIKRTIIRPKKKKQIGT